MTHLHDLAEQIACRLSSRAHEWWSGIGDKGELRNEIVGMADFAGTDAAVAYVEAMAAPEDVPPQSSYRDISLHPADSMPRLLARLACWSDVQLAGLSDAIERTLARRAKEAHVSDSLPIGQQLRTAREAAGLRQYVLAAKAGIPQTHLSDIERGKHPPSNATLFALADALSLGIVGRTGHWQLVPGEAIEELLKKYPEVQ